MQEHEGLQYERLCRLAQTTPEQIPMTSGQISRWVNPDGEAFLLCTMHTINDLSFAYQMSDQLYVHLTFRQVMEKSERYDFKTRVIGD